VCDGWTVGGWRDARRGVGPLARMVAWAARAARFVVRDDGVSATRDETSRGAEYTPLWWRLLAGGVVLCALAGCSGHGASSVQQRRARRSSHRPSDPSTLTTSTTTPDSTTTMVAVPSTTPDGLPEVIAHGPRDRPLVALTFDSNLTDAMIAELDRGQVRSFYNAAVIDELDQMQVPATIFLAGKWIERYPEATRRLAADPLFELGSHSYAHRAFHLPCYGLGGLPEALMAPDVEHSEELLRQFTDRPSPYFRFPGGCYDATALRAIAPVGVTIIQYDVASGDAFGHSVSAIVDNTLRQAQNGSIVVMHITDGNTAPLTAYALPSIVHGLRARGFTLVKVSDLLGTDQRQPQGTQPLTTPR
jgi:peptidoglycan-N-acetylglucosamine deacetylase